MIPKTGLSILPKIECNLPQEPPAIYIDPHGIVTDDGIELVFVTKKDWGLLGGYIYGAQQFMRAAGPCLGRNRSESDVPPPGSGAIGKTVGQ